MPESALGWVEDVLDILGTTKKAALHLKLVYRVPDEYDAVLPLNGSEPLKLMRVTPSGRTAYTRVREKRAPAPLLGD